MEAATEATKIDSHVIKSINYDAILNTNLAVVLAEDDNQRVVMSSVEPDHCVYSIARGAAGRGFETWIVTDA